MYIYIYAYIRIHIHIHTLDAPAAIARPPAELGRVVDVFINELAARAAILRHSKVQHVHMYKVQHIHIYAQSWVEMFVCIYIMHVYHVYILCEYTMMCIFFFLQIWVEKFL